MANPLYDEIVGRNAGRETPFLILPDGQAISHRAFLDRAARFATALAGMGTTRLLRGALTSASWYEPRSAGPRSTE